MNHLKITDSFNEIISIGLLSREKKIGNRVFTAWEQKFDISGWKGWEISSVIAKNEIIEHGSVQEVVLRGIFKHKNELGYTTLVATIITVNRSLPDNFLEDELSETKVIPNCFWIPVQVRYYESPATMSNVICLDPLQSD